MAKISPGKNAGVHNSTGIEFQKHCALYFLLDKYQSLKNQKYFICLEHHDDFLFCYLSETDLIKAIDSYQAKKASSDWSMSNPFFEIIKKITEVGLDLKSDTHPKDPQYSHSLTFVTNQAIKLHCGTTPKTIREKLLINDAHTLARYSDLHAKIQSNIVKNLNSIGVSDTKQMDELGGVSLLFVDLPKTAAKQKQVLVGMFYEIFGSKVNDPVAAVDSLLLLFRNVENVLNSGNMPKLLDSSKRVDSTTIAGTIRIITEKAKAYDLWRTKGDYISKNLTISIFDQKKFALHFDNSLDLFKDLTQKSHQNIKNYVSKNKVRWSSHTDDVECLQDIYKCYLAEKSTNLSDIELKAAIYAAYVILKD